MQTFLTISFAALTVIFGCLWYLQKKKNQSTRLKLTETRDEHLETLRSQKKKSQSEQERLLNTLSDPFFLVSSDATIIFANEATVDLVAGRILLGRNIKEVFLDERFTDAIEECLNKGKATIKQIKLSSQASPRGPAERRGETSWLIDAAPLDRNNENSIIRVTIQDLTAEHHSEQVRKDFVANASHELRTPLSIINGYLENLVEGEINDTGQLKHALTVMKKHGDRIAKIVDDMLMISRLESGAALTLNITQFKFTSCIHDVLERLEPMILEQNAQTEILVQDPEIEITGDRFYWTQVFFNLIENALKQNPKTPLHVEIGAKSGLDNTLTLWVADNGVGIASADLPFVFRRFYRVEKHHNQDSIKGTGLGLSIVKRTIEAHQGTISVTSEPGQRTAFEITLPLTNPDKS